MLVDRAVQRDRAGSLRQRRLDLAPRDRDIREPARPPPPGWGPRTRAQTRDRARNSGLAALQDRHRPHPFILSCPPYGGLPRLCPFLTHQYSSLSTATGPRHRPRRVAELRDRAVADRAARSFACAGTAVLVGGSSGTQLLGCSGTTSTSPPPARLPRSRRRLAAVLFSPPSA